MSILWKLLLGLGIALPITAYVLGSLVASADDPDPRPPIVITDSGASTGPSTPARNDGNGRNQQNPNGREDNRRDDDRGDDDGVEAVVPSPDDLDDSDDDAGRDDDGDGDSGPGGGDDDNSGPGGGGDDSSGHGSGGDDD